MRTTAEWIGKTDDQPPPPRVKIRIFRKHDGICAECGLKILGGKWVCDHRIALINGGANREANLQPIHGRCDAVKTPRDVKQKAKNDRVLARHIGVQQQQRRPMPGSRNSPIKMKIGGGWEWRK